MENTWQVMQPRCDHGECDCKKREVGHMYLSSTQGRYWVLAEREDFPFCYLETWKLCTPMEKENES